MCKALVELDDLVVVTNTAGGITTTATTTGTATTSTIPSTTTPAASASTVATASEPSVHDDQKGARNLLGRAAVSLLQVIGSWYCCRLALGLTPTPSPPRP